MKHTFSFFQLSDMHWRLIDISSNEPKLKMVKGLLATFRSEVEEAAKGLSHSSANVLILNGDNVFGAMYNAFPVLRDELIVPIANMKIDEKFFFNAIVAVPGNHDIQRASDDKFHFFEEAIEGLKNLIAPEIKIVTPFSTSPLYTIPFGNSGKSITVWAGNSSEVCGDLDVLVKDSKESFRNLSRIISEIPTITPALKEFVASWGESLKQNDKPDDPGYISDESRRNCIALLRDCGKDVLRIAVVHHNVLPSINDDALRQKFWNGGQFTQFLLDNKFRLLCHGHQHIAGVAAYTRSVADRQGFQSYLADNLLSIGAPALDISQTNNTHQGFNTITLDFTEEHDVCSVNVIQHRWLHDKQRFDLRSETYDLATDRPDPQDTERWHAIADANRIIYSKKRLDGLVRAFDDVTRYKQSHAASLRERLNRLKNVRAVYALSVFPPGNWLNSKLMEVFMPYGRRTIELATARGTKHSNLTSIETSPLIYEFSSPLVVGINTAKNNCTRLNISGYLSEAIRRLSEQQFFQAVDFLSTTNIHSSFIGTSCSMWGNSITLTEYDQQGKLDYNKRRVVVVDDLGFRPYRHYSPKDTERYSQSASLFEFARIVLWDKDELLRPSTLDIIQYHETMGFPLFWLPINRLRSKSGKQREKIGYVSIVAVLPPNEKSFQSTHETCHYANEARLDNPENFMSQAWHGEEPEQWLEEGLSLKFPYGGLSGDARPLHEFICLMGRKDLVFAADAWVAAQSGHTGWTEFTGKL